MKLLTCLLKVTLVAAWDPVRAGVLVKKIVDMIHDKVAHALRDYLKVINNGIKLAEEEKGIDNVRMYRKISRIKKEKRTFWRVISFMQEIKEQLVRL